MRIAQAERKLDRISVTGKPERTVVIKIKLKAHVQRRNMCSVDSSIVNDYCLHLSALAEMRESVMAAREEGTVLWPYNTLLDNITTLSKYTHQHGS